MLGKAVEVLSLREGHGSLSDYLNTVNALPLRDYVPNEPALAPGVLYTACCRGILSAAEPDDDINYTVLALMLLEEWGAELDTEHVARAWLRYLPLASTYTAERAAYRTLAARCSEWFPEGAEADFDLTDCADNPYNDWIGAQIRADLYGWVCPGKPALAADLVGRDARLSHRGEGVHGAVYIAALGALLGGGLALDKALEAALTFIPADSLCTAAITGGRELADSADGGDRIREEYAALSAVHTVNNLSLVVWALSRHRDDYSAAIGDVVSAGLDTDCNGATVGGLWALQGKPVPQRWTDPWQGRVRLSLAGLPDLSLEDLVDRTLAVAKGLGSHEVP
jgi:ADP-ribosylglycohydrolase